MKKIFAAMVILGLGFAVGCGDDKGATKTTGASTTKTTTETTKTTITPAHDSK